MLNTRDTMSTTSKIRIDLGPKFIKYPKTILAEYNKYDEYDKYDLDFGPKKVLLTKFWLSTTNTMSTTSTT